WTHLIPSPFSCSAHRRRRRLLTSPSQLSAYFYHRRCLRALKLPRRRPAPSSGLSGAHLSTLMHLGPSSARLAPAARRGQALLLHAALVHGGRSAISRGGAQGGQEEVRRRVRSHELLGLTNHHPRGHRRLCLGPLASTRLCAGLELLLDVSLRSGPCRSSSAPAPALTPTPPAVHSGRAPFSSC
ncbi:unnamed protein product, partial [Urochloa humidicola]